MSGRACKGAASACAALLLGLWVFAAPARAISIERVISPGGIEAWLVHHSAVPVIALEFSALGGADQDPAEKPGVANLAASLLDEGAGNLDAVAFHDRLERRGIELQFQAGHDYLRGTLRTLTEHRDEAFEALRLSLSSPRFDTEAVERMRAQVVSQLRRESVSPGQLASRAWWAAAFPSHPYGRPVNGTLESVPRINVPDLKTYVGHVLAREHLKIAVVGDIDAATAGALLDRTFGALPAHAQLQQTPDITVQGLGRRIVIPLDVPQANISFGAPGIARNDPDFMAAYILNHILGGGSFSSRLYREVREKRGLAYGVSDALIWLRHSALLYGTTATRSDATGKSIEIIGQEIQRLAEEGPSAEELHKAKTYLKGSFALALDSSSHIAGQLLQMQTDELGIDYIDRRSGLIDAVTLADAKRVAKRLLQSGLLVTVAGRPDGVTSN